MTELAIKIPEQMIEDAIRAQIVAQLSGSGTMEKFLEQIIKESLKQPDRNTYGRDTLFRTEVKKMIRNECTVIFTAWLDENRELLKTKLYAELNSRKQKRLKECVEAMVNSIGDLSIQISMKMIGED